MKQSWQLIALTLFLGIIFNAQAADPAELSIYLFENGMPLSEAGLTTGTTSHGLTDINGYIQVSLPPGQHVLTFRQAEKELLSLDIPLIAGENAQVIVTTYTDGRAPVIDIQTSHPDGELAVEDATNQTKIAAKGIISGLVVSAESKKPVSGARVFFSGIATELRTSQDGTFRTEVPAGDYSISIMHPNFSAQVRDGIEIAADATREEAFSLTPAGIELPEHVVLEPMVAGSLAAIVEEQRNSSSVANVLGAEQISRSGDSDAAGALRRTTGLTLVGGKFIFIRGLGERYSSTLLNGASIPSPDPTRRVVPLDLFPTSVIDSILIQKSYSVDRPAEFAGGTVEIRTKTIPDGFFFQLSTQMGINQGETFTKGLRYKGGDTDIFGVDDGTRKMPDSLAAAISGGKQLAQFAPTNPSGLTREELQVLGNDLSGTFDINKKNIGPDHRINVAMGDKFSSGDFSFGYTTTARWSNSWDTRNETQRFFTPLGDGRLERVIDNKVNFTER
ncbi:MAG: carboxypeptidase regulatory-like domain-containing protein, partial [Nitrosomonas sp.]|nr:carboxypeptidase regulatory-like domain-containing protein [Nitrosomonas sp.]